MRLFIVFFIINIFFSACQEVATPTKQADKPNIFFDLKGFFQKEKARLEKINSFKKIVSIDGVSEEKTLATLDFENELSIFIASDINRPAWSDKYKVDSTFTKKSQLTKLTYTALDNSLKTKSLIIDFQNDTASKIAIEKSTDNTIAQSKQLLTYNTGKGYTIQSEQTLSLSSTKTIRVNVTY